MLARQWGTVADQCFAAMVPIFWYFGLSQSSIAGHKPPTEGKDQPGVEARSHGPQPGGGDGEDGDPGGGGDAGGG